VDRRHGRPTIYRILCSPGSTGVGPINQGFRRLFTAFPQSYALRVKAVRTELETRRRRHFEQFPTRGWTFITPHAQVLLAVAANPDLRVTEIAEAADITERYAYRVLSDLEKAGYVDRRRRGRCNRYRVDADLALGDPVVEEQSIRGLLQLSGRSAGGYFLAAPSRRRRSA
jgi:DNA-binding transcriptional ArsR family regulator